MGCARSQAPARPRSAVGLTATDEIVFAVSAGSCARLAVAMKELGCRDAMNLDGGASSGLWIRGRGYVRPPGRLIGNALLLVKK